MRIDLPLDSAYEVERDWLLVKLKTEWKVGGRSYPADALLATSFSGFLAGGRDFAVLFEPGPRRVLSSFWWAKTRLVLTVLDNLASRILLAEPREGGWRIEPLAGLPEEADLDGLAARRRPARAHRRVAALDLELHRADEARAGGAGRRDRGAEGERLRPSTPRVSW